MKSLRIIPAAVLLLTVCSGPVFADDPVRLPDLSGALQARIDGLMSSILGVNPSVRQADAPAAVSPRIAYGANAEVEHAPVRTDEPGWKPYHSAM